MKNNSRVQKQRLFWFKCELFGNVINVLHDGFRGKNKPK